MDIKVAEVASFKERFMALRSSDVIMRVKYQPQQVGSAGADFYG
jgi:hypothetical protein